MALGERRGRNGRLEHVLPVSYAVAPSTNRRGSSSVGRAAAFQASPPQRCANPRGDLSEIDSVMRPHQATGCAADGQHGSGYLSQRASECLLRNPQLDQMIGDRSLRFGDLVDANRDGRLLTGAILDRSEELDIAEAWATSRPFVYSTIDASLVARRTPITSPSLYPVGSSSTPSATKARSVLATSAVEMDARGLDDATRRSILVDNLGRVLASVRPKEGR
jgi:hypothetical protein